MCEACNGSGVVATFPPGVCMVCDGVGKHNPRAQYRARKYQQRSARYARRDRERSRRS